MREKLICWGFLALACSIAGQATVDAWKQTGKPYPGFGVMDSLLVAVGGLERAGLAPFDFVRAIDGRVLHEGREIQAVVGAYPAGTPFRYIVNRRGQLIEADIPSVARSAEDFHRYLIEGVLPGVLFLLLGAAVLWLKPALPETRVFLAFCLTWFGIAGLYLDAHTTYRFDALFLAAVAVSPAVYIHLGLTFPERRRISLRWPWLVWLPYGVSALMAIALLRWISPPSPDWLLLVPAASTVYWGAALTLLIISLGRTSWWGSTPLIRQRARVLVAGFAVGQLVPVLGTMVEAVSGLTVPALDLLWRLNFLFPLAVAYAMVRYNLFDVRAVIRVGTIYAVVTGLVVLAYAGAIALVNVSFSGLGLSTSPLVPAVIVALAVVLFLNPVYVRTQAVVDRLFFRQRRDAQAALERLSDEMTTLLDLDRIVHVIRRTAGQLFAPTRIGLLLFDEARAVYRPLMERPDGPQAVPHDSPLMRRLEKGGAALTREQVREDPALMALRDVGLAQMAAFEIELLAPIFFRQRMTALVGLGAKRSGAAYTTEDLRVLRMLCNQTAVALENAKAYTALQVAHGELRSALRRVEILETIRASLSKFVPKAVQELIEQAPEAPELDKREVDVSVLFVDIAGYTRLSERLDADKVNDLVERYFGAFLDEILTHHGDVNETAGDGLMVIFRDEDPRGHAQAAVLTALGILRRAREINAGATPGSMPIAFHIGVNSGIAAVGATKIEGNAGTRWTYTASGTVTNVAARLAALGEGEEIFIGPETRRRLDAGLPLEDLGDRQLKNVDGPVRVYRLAATIEVG